ncbi:MAG: hypothetical protein NVSMB66_6020 [Candidatus Doudnabacteria bacterium]
MYKFIGIGAMLLVVGCSGGVTDVPVVVTPTISIAASPSFEVLDHNSTIVLSASNATSCSATRTPAEAPGRGNSIPPQFTIWGCDSIITNPGSTMAADYDPKVIPTSTYVVMAKNGSKTATATVTIPLHAAVNVSCTDMKLQNDTVRNNSGNTMTFVSTSIAFTARNVAFTYPGTEIILTDPRTGKVYPASTVFLSPQMFTYGISASGSLQYDDSSYSVRIPGIGGVVCPFVLHFRK